MAYPTDYRRGGERDEEFRRSRGSEENFGGREEYGEPYGRDYERIGRRSGQQDFRERYGQQGFGRQGFGGQRGEQSRYGRSPEYREEGYRRYGESYGRGPEGFDREYGAEFSRGTPGSGGGYGYEETQRYGESFGTVGRYRGRFTGRGPKGYIRSDDRIREDVSDRLEQHGEIDATEIEVRVSNGEVTLEGTVEDRRTKRMAEDLVENSPGVKQVHNRLLVQGSTGQSISSRQSTTTSGTSGSSYRPSSPPPKS
jgi:hypothetical protein